MSVHLRWTKNGTRRYDVRLRDPSGNTYTRTFRTRREAEAFEADERASRRRGNWLDPRRSEEPLRAVAARWLDSNPAKRPSSRARDDSALRVHILPALGDRSIGHSPRPTSSDASTTGPSISHHGPSGGCTRPYRRCLTPPCSTIESLGRPVEESGCRPSSPPIDPYSPEISWRISPRRRGLPTGQWFISGRCSGFVGASAPVSASAGSTSTGRPSLSPNRSPEAPEDALSSDHPSPRPPDEPCTNRPRGTPRRPS